ncbi:hypothetical protein [Catellatospora methionotrophica]|nr:hypothetical protein [Catellatospora methionotrophica]
MPTDAALVRAAATAQIEAWVRDGIAAAGGLAQVAVLAQRSRELGTLRARARATVMERQEYAAMWPSSARANLACALAYHVIRRRIAEPGQLPRH